MNDKPANHHDLRSLIRDDTYAASFQSLGQYRTALLEYAETAMQGEPAGYVSTRRLEALRSGRACGITMEDKPDAHNGVTIPLYTAPQPAEQQPPPDVAGLDIEELYTLLMILRNSIGGTGLTLDGEVKELAVRTENAISAIVALAAHRKQGGEA